MGHSVFTFSNSKLPLLGYGIIDICVMMDNGSLPWLFNLLNVTVLQPDDPLLPIMILLLTEDAVTNNCPEVVTDGLNMQCVVQCLADDPEKFSDLIYKVLLLGDGALGLGDLGLIGPIVPDVIKNLIGKPLT